MNHWIRPVHLQVVLIILFVNGNLFSGVDGLDSTEAIAKEPLSGIHYPQKEDGGEEMEDASNTDIYKSVNYLIDLAEFMIKRLHELGFFSNECSYPRNEMENPASWGVFLPPHKRQCCPPIWPGADNPDSWNRGGPDFNPPPINPYERVNVIQSWLPGKPQEVPQNARAHDYVPVPSPSQNPEKLDRFMGNPQLPNDKFDLSPMSPLQIPRNTLGHHSVPVIPSEYRSISVDPPPINPENPNGLQDILHPSGRAYHGLLWPWTHQVQVISRRGSDKSVLDDKSGQGKKLLEDQN